MAHTSSNSLPLGTNAPEFALPDVVTGKTISLSELKDKKAYLIMFICRHCPYVVHVQEELTRLGQDYVSRDIAIVAISSNDANRYPEDAPSKLKEMALTLKFNFPLCYDESQRVALAHQAECTPDFFLFDAHRQLIYRGQLDGSRPSNGKKVDGADLRAALEAVLTGGVISPKQTPSMGCGIKWKT